MKTIKMAGLSLLIAGSMAFAQSGTTAPTNNVNVNVSAEAGLTIAGNAVLASSGTNFSDYTGATNFTYYIRTSVGGGVGAITLQVTSDFSPAGGPSVATPPTAGDALTYVNTVSAPGSAAAGTQTASTSGVTQVGSFGADAHSVKLGNAGSTAWTLTNDPLYKTGAYAAVVTYTISAS